MSLIYSNMLFILQMRFPELPWSSETAKNSYDLPYIIFGLVFVPFIKENILNNNQEEIIRIFDFLEDMACSQDENVRDLLQVGILEALWEDANIFHRAVKNMHNKTLEINQSIGSYLRYPK